MRRIILGSLFAVSLALPAAAFAAPATGGNTRGLSGMDQDMSRDRSLRPHDQPQNGTSNSSLGNGAVGGNEPGHVESPGTTKIDPESRGPINDVQPGRGTNDTPQSANPKPVP